MCYLEGELNYLLFDLLLFSSLIREFQLVVVFIKDYVWALMVVRAGAQC